MEIPSETKEKLSELARKFEVAEFTGGDPSQFIRWYAAPSDAEPACFIAAMLSFGSRKQFIPKIRQIFGMADLSGGMRSWLVSGKFSDDFRSPDGNSSAKFYRFYSYSDMNSLFVSLRRILVSGGTMGGYFRRIYRDGDFLPDVICAEFAGCPLVPHGKDCANKRVNMFLRWMVRRNSPVDAGFWDWYPQRLLVIPLDVHVMQEAQKLGLVPPRASAGRKTALSLTERLREIWPDDPCRGDFALFGAGVAEK